MGRAPSISPRKVGIVVDMSEDLVIIKVALRVPSPLERVCQQNFERGDAIIADPQFPFRGNFSG